MTKLSHVEQMYAHRFCCAPIVASDSSSCSVTLIYATGKHGSVEVVACSTYGTAGHCDRLSVDQALVQQLGPSEMHTHAYPLEAERHGRPSMQLPRNQRQCFRHLNCVWLLKSCPEQCNHCAVSLDCHDGIKANTSGSCFTVLSTRTKAWIHSWMKGLFTT